VNTDENPIESHRPWFVDAIDCLTCEMIAIELRIVLAHATKAHGLTPGARVQCALRCGLHLGSALALLPHVQDEPTRDRARELASWVGTFASLTLECPGQHGVRCMGLGGAEL
jgi:hypothetical protein